MTEQGRELLGAGCGNREGRRPGRAERMGWVGGRLPAALNRLLSLGDQAHLEVIR